MKKDVFLNKVGNSNELLKANGSESASYSSKDAVVENDTILKYPRRTKRTIGNTTYELLAPNTKVSGTMQKIKGSNIF